MASRILFKQKATFLFRLIALDETLDVATLEISKSQRAGNRAGDEAGPSAAPLSDMAQAARADKPGCAAAGPAAGIGMRAVVGAKAEDISSEGNAVGGGRLLAACEGGESEGG